MDMPRWYSQLQWSAPQRVLDLDPEAAPLGAGIYVYTENDLPLSPTNVLYVGKADGARQTLRSRIGVYLRRFRSPTGKPSKHAGLEQLNGHFRTRPTALFLRWAGVVAARDVEGRLIELFDPDFNNKDEHRHGFADDELIPDEYLY